MLHQLERYFDNFHPEKNIPQILYKVNKTSHEWELDVKNINELNDRFSKPIMLHTLVLFKDHLNYECQIKNDTTNKPYTLSPNFNLSLLPKKEPFL